MCMKTLIVSLESLDVDTLIRVFGPALIVVGALVGACATFLSVFVTNYANFLRQREDHKHSQRIKEIELDAQRDIAADKMTFDRDEYERKHLHSIQTEVYIPFLECYAMEVARLSAIRTRSSVTDDDGGAVKLNKLLTKILLYAPKELIEIFVEAESVLASARLELMAIRFSAGQDPNLLGNAMLQDVTRAFQLGAECSGFNSKLIAAVRQHVKLPLEFAWIDACIKRMREKNRKGVESWKSLASEIAVRKNTDVAAEVVEPSSPKEVEDVETRAAI
jgi:hypothetical protein